MKKEQEEVVILGYAFQLFCKEDFLPIVGILGEYWISNGKKWPQNNNLSMMKNTLQITCLRLLTHLNKQLVDLENDCNDESGKPITPRHVMDTLLTIDHAYQNYLLPEDLHKLSIKFVFDRTIKLAEKVLVKHKLLEDFKQIY